MKRRLLILLAATGLLVSACGASGDSSSSAEEGGGGSSTTVAEASGSSFGSLKDVCGPGEAKLQAGEGSSTTALNIGVANDRGSTVRPGLNKELWDASQSFAAWCNEQGGIDGMKINLIDMDGKLFEVEAAMAKACNDAFAMVGGAFTQDQLEFSGKDGTDFHKCKLIDIPGFAVSVEKGLSNGQVQPVPNPPNKKATQWITDAKTIEPEELLKVYGTKVLVINALRRKTHISHFTLDEAVALVNQVVPERAFLTHLSHQMGLHAEVESELPDHVRIAYDGLQITI